MRITENENAYSTQERQKIIYKFLLENSNKDKAVSTQRIIDLLSTYEIKTHINTLYADLKEIEATYEVSIKYDQRKKGYILSGTMFEPYEIKLIAHSIESFKFLTQKKALELIGKLKTLTDTKTASSIYSDAYVIDRVHNMNESIIKDAERLYEAIAQDKKVKFIETRYSYDTDSSTVRLEKQTVEVSPYKLIWENGDLKLLAYCREEGYMGFFLTFDVKRMEKIYRPLNTPREGKGEYRNIMKRFKSQGEFNIHEFDFGFEHNSKQLVKLRFLNRLANDVIDKFGEDLTLIPDGDYYITTFETDIDDNSFIDWIIRYGSVLDILYPTSLKEKVESELRHIKNTVIPKWLKDDGEM